MTLAWTMDKLGPITRSVEDCALVFDAIHGADGLDFAAVDQPFVWPPSRELEKLKVGYIEEPRRPSEERQELKILRKLGFELVPITLPNQLPVRAITLMLGTEAAAAFDELTRKHVTEGLNSWPDTFRQGQFVPAVEYLRAARVRTKLMHAMEERMADRRPLRQLGPGPGDHQPDRPPQRGVPDGIPGSQRTRLSRIGHPHRTALRRVNPARRRSRISIRHRRSPQATPARAVSGGGGCD